MSNLIGLFVLLLCPLSCYAQDQSIAANKLDKKEETRKIDPAKRENETENQTKPSATPEPAGSGLLSNLNLLIDIGAQARSVSGERPSKFEEFKRVREGFLFRRFRLASNPVNSPKFFRLIGRGPTEIDQQYLLDAGEYGRYRTKVEWNQLPKLFSRGSRTPYVSQGNGFLAVPDSIKATLQPLLDAKSSTLASVAANIFRNSPLTNIRQTRETLSINQTFQVTPHWSVRARFLDYKRYGSKPLGIGAYERLATPNAEIGITTTIGDGFRIINLELPEQIDSRSNQITFGTSYVRQHWGVNFDYTFSQFRNRIEALVFENPFRLTDKQATSGGNFNRQEFARGIFAEEPSNYGHNFVVSAFVDLPGHSRLASALGWSTWKQNEPFLPFTLNTAITASNLPAGVTPTSLSALPRQTLEGEIDTFTQDHVFASRPAKNFSFDIHYRSYDYDNKTPDILFPGYAAFSESFWRTSIVGTFGTELIENRPVSFHRQNFTAEATWDVAKWLDWKVEYQWEGWDREHRQVAHSNENTFGTQLSYKPTNRFNGRLIYRYSDRTPRDYDPGVLESQQLRKFDQAKRIRHNANLQWQYSLNPKLGLSGTFSYLRDNYDKNFFGLVRYLQGQGSVDLLYMPNETTTFYANYSRERYSSLLQSITKTGVPFDLRNRWNREDRNLNDSFGVGVTTYVAKGRLLIDANYALSLSNDRITTANLTAISPTAILNATAFPFPDVKSNYHELNLDTNYQLTDNVALGFRYIFEPYRLDDFQWNGLNPYPFDRLPAEQQFPTTRPLLLDSRYSSHNVHVFGVYLRFSKGKNTP
ncbi:MAG TPA: MtrB/PioB family decaheme-associated outer membrane protein [Pyrinomonadaceae bacterium]|nr:MtrB/PioB family decaheme-associated outer membrane protein [Pyrinomonadaceae bacterium]